MECGEKVRLESNTKEIFKETKEVLGQRKVLPSIINPSMDSDNITTTLMHQQPERNGTYKHLVGT